MQYNAKHSHACFSLMFLLHVLSIFFYTTGAAATNTATQFLNPHNALRSSLGLPSLQWSTNLVNYAKWYANQRRGDCALLHSTGNYGENLFWGKGSGWKISDAVAAWAAEGKYYDYMTNLCRKGEDCTHYTQMVWRRTKSVGCVKMICKNGDTFIICNYDPHGNIMGARPY